MFCAKGTGKVTIVPLIIGYPVGSLLYVFHDPKITYFQPFTCPGIAGAGDYLEYIKKPLFFMLRSGYVGGFEYWEYR